MPVIGAAAGSPPVTLTLRHSMLAAGLGIF